MKEQDQTFQFNFDKFEFLTSHTGQYKNIIAAAETEDDIGTVLRLHLLLEKDLEAWSACATGNGDLFKGFGENLTLTFAAKNQLAFNLGLSEDLFKVIKRINKIRNDRSHQIDNLDITDPEIESLTGLVSVNYPANLYPVQKFQARINQGAIYDFVSRETPNRIKFLMLFTMLKMRMCEEAKAQMQKK